MRFLPILLAATALAQQAAQRTGTVEGRVVNQITGEGIRKAAVRIYASRGRGGPMGGAETVSEPDGSFRIDGITPGTYRITAERPGFVYARDPRRGDSEIEVPAGPVRAGDIKLVPHAVVTGRITDEDGDPVQGAQVQASRYQYMSGRRQLLPMAFASTNDLGEYRLHGILPGKYVLSVSKGGRMGPTFGPPGPPMARPIVKPPEGEEKTYVTTYFPGGLDLAAATQLALSAGQEYRGADIRISKVAVYRIRGTVTGVVHDPNHRGWPSAIVYLYPGGEAGFLASDRRPAPVDTKTGAFELRGVRPGNYTVVVQQQGGPNSRTGYSTVNVGEGDVDGLQLQVRDAGPVKGRITAEGGEADLTAAQIQLLPASGFAAAAPMVKPDASGAFALANVAPLRYRVAVTSLPDGYYLKSVQIAGRQVENAEADFSAGVAGEISVQLAKGTGAVEGAVRDGKGDPLPNIKVTLAPDSSFSSWAELYREITSGADGSFRFSNLRPGSYRVYAWQNIEPGAHQDPEFLKPFESQSSSVNVTAGSPVTVHPKPIAIAGTL